MKALILGRMAAACRGAEALVRDVAVVAWKMPSQPEPHLGQRSPRRTESPATEDEIPSHRRNNGLRLWCVKEKSDRVGSAHECPPRTPTSAPCSRRVPLRSATTSPAS